MGLRTYECSHRDTTWPFWNEFGKQRGYVVHCLYCKALLPAAQVFKRWSHPAREARPHG